jgi:hypothetical protein
MDDLLGDLEPTTDAASSISATDAAHAGARPPAQVRPARLDPAAVPPRARALNQF